MMVALHKQAELHQAMLREQHAYERRIAAYVRVKEAFVECGSAALTDRRLREAEQIDEEWRVAKAELAELTAAFRKSRLLQASIGE